MPKRKRRKRKEERFPTTDRSLRIYDEMYFHYLREYEKKEKEEEKQSDEHEEE